MEDIVSMTPALSVPASSITETVAASAVTVPFVSSQDHHHQQVNHLEMPEERLLSHPEGMNIALEQAKVWAKYAKDLLAYLEKRTQIEMEYHRSIIKNAHNLKNSIGDEVSFDLFCHNCSISNTKYTTINSIVFCSISRHFYKVFWSRSREWSNFVIKF